MTISILIPTYNGRSLLEKNLPAVLAAGEMNEVIVVDDASTDGTEKWLRSNYPEVKLIRNRKNLRFGESCNRGIKKAEGKIVLLLNNDVRPEKDFLKWMVGDFEDEKVFAVGCREKNIENGKELYEGRGISAFKRGLMVHWRPENQESKRAIWLSGGSMAVRKELWLKLGGFDNLFRPAYEEDRDICWQALKAGYKLAFEPRSIVGHDHETTNKLEFGGKNIALYSMKNQLLFVWKNISDIGLLMRHILWLPYHLTATAIRTRGLFWLSFLMALIQLPEAAAARKRARRNWIMTDRKVLELP